MSTCDSHVPSVMGSKQNHGFPQTTEFSATCQTKRGLSSAVEMKRRRKIHMSFPLAKTLKKIIIE